MSARSTVRTTHPTLAAAMAVLALLAVAHPLQAQSLRVDAAPAHPYLRAGEKSLTYLKVGLTGERLEPARQRPPVNIAIVLDTSGSMQGEKIRRAKDAALASLDRLGPNDIVSVLAYDDTVDVLVPATKLVDKAAVRAAIQRLQAGGSTALFAGVTKGAAELRKFLDRQRVNRLLLLSDGQANIGPSSPGELGEMGASLIKEGISVTTFGLGLGYNEDLMTQLARRSDGNHYFIEHATDLARRFDYEFDDVLSVAAQEVTVRITVADGVRPVRVLGREADITGQTVTTYLNQVYGDQEKYVLLEVEVPASRAGAERPLAKVDVAFVDMRTRTAARAARQVSTRFTDTPGLVDTRTNPVIMAAVVEQIAVERNKAAVELRDQGRIEEARRALLANAAYLREQARRYESKALADYVAKNELDASRLEGEAWTQQRKNILDEQNIRQSQQAPRER